MEQDEKVKAQRERAFNGLSASEWTSMSSSVWSGMSSPRDPDKLKHGATFPQMLAERLIQMYSKAGDNVLDPFAGSGTTLCAALYLDRFAFGIELNPEYVQMCKRQVMATIEGNEDALCDNYVILDGDCTEQLRLLPDESMNLVVTSPPYADLLRKVEKDRQTAHKNSRIVTENNSTSKPYSDDARDLGNMDVEKWTDSVGQVMKQLHRVMTVGAYNCWVVKDFRDTKHGKPYIDLHTIVAKCAEQAGLVYHDLIIWDQNQNRKLVCLGYPSVFYTNQNHSYIVVTRKVGPK